MRSLCVLILVHLLFAPPADAAKRKVPGHYLRGPGHHNLLLGNKATKCGTYGFHLITSGNTLVQNKGWKNSEFDLYDINPVGSNAYLDNSFEKIGP